MWTSAIASAGLCTIKRIATTSDTWLHPLHPISLCIETKISSNIMCDQPHPGLASWQERHRRSRTLQQYSYEYT
eukprot:scaffold476201_cov13-Prasinocladus_malaysianus.AAC.1